MTPTILDELARLRRDGPRRFAAWDGAAFERAAGDPARALAESLAGQPDGGVVVASYLRVAQQAAGTGMIRTEGESGDSGGPGFLARLLLDVVPRRLAEVPAGRRAAVLAEVWNLGEGVSREPDWVRRYVGAVTAGLDSLEDLPGVLVGALGPVIKPAPPAAWSGPLRATVVNLRKAHDRFLPGRLRLAAPAVLCVDDRRGGPSVGVLFRRGGCEVLGVFPTLGEYAQAADLPVVAAADGRATVGPRSVAVPGLRRCHTTAVAAAGFVAFSAVDSQRLWVIESD